MAIQPIAAASRTEPPGPFAWPFFGNAFTFLKDMPNFVLRLARDYGEISRFRMGGDNLYLVDRPEWIQKIMVTDADCFIKGRGLQRAKRMLGQGLLTSEGSFHLRQRRLAQPAFHKNHLEVYGQWMTRYAAEHIADWSGGEVRDLAVEMQRLTLRIVGRTLFDADVTGDAKEVGEALEQFMDVFPYLLIAGSEFLDNLPLPINRKLAQARAKLDHLVYSLIREKRRNPGSDLLSLLLLATDVEGDGTGMSDEQARDEAITMFLAGHETTANAITWLYYLLSLNPRAREAVHREIDEVLGGQPPTVESYPRLEFTRRAMSEALRLFPPAWGTTRRTLVDYDLAGYRFPAGAVFFLSPYVTHRNPRYWPEPLAFEPDRFLHTPEKFSYFPFGGGRRLCIGERFAWMEGVLLVATISQRWQLEYEGNFPVAHKASLTLRPKGGMPMRLKPRGHLAR